MKQATFDELSGKEVINTSDCRRLGYISDLCIDLECGRVLSFAVRPCGGFFGLSQKEQIIIPWENITKIGDDLIFVNICHAAPPPPPKKRFFG